MFISFIFHLYNTYKKPLFFSDLAPIYNTFLQNNAPSTSFANIQFGASGSYKSFTEHPKRSKTIPDQSKLYSSQSTKTPTAVLNQQNNLRSPRNIERL